MPYSDLHPEHKLVAQSSPAPTRKVTAAGVGGALATVIVWLIQVLTGQEVPPGIEGALATIAAAGLGYMVRERA